MEKSKTILINNKEVKIKKMAIGQFAKLMLAIEKLPDIISKNFSLEEVQNLEVQTLLTKLPLFLANSQDEIFKVVEVASGIKKKEIEELDIEEFIDVVTAVLELNNFKAIVNKVKNFRQILQSK
jgi:hypothetical protein